MYGGCGKAEVGLHDGNGTRGSQIPVTRPGVRVVIGAPIG